jgi:hypothetical protein
MLSDSVLQGVSSIRKVRSKYGQDGYRSINTTLSHPWSRSQVLKETVDHTYYFGNEGPFSQLSVEAYLLDELSRPIWAIVDSADTGYVWRSDDYVFYRTAKEGCCDGATTQRLYSLDDGKPVVSSDDSIFILDLDNTDIYVGNRSPNGMHRSPQVDWREGRFAAFEVATSAKRRSSVVLHSTEVEELELFYGIQAHLASRSEPGSVLAASYTSDNISVYESDLSEQPVLRVYIGWNDSAFHYIPITSNGLNPAGAFLPAHVTATLEPLDY